MLLLSSLTLFYLQISNVDSFGELLSYYLGGRRLCLCRCGVPQANTGIFGRRLGGKIGEPIPPYQMPWLAYIHANNSIVLGTVISDRHIITAASPVYGLLPSQVTVRIGSYDQCDATTAFNSSLESIIINPGYTKSRRNNDLALLKLRQAVTFSQYVVPICMPLFDVVMDQLAWIASISRDDAGTSSCTPRIASLPILSTSSCATNANTTLLTPDKACLGPVGTSGVLCEEDIGSAVMTRWTTRSPYRLIGVLSSASCNNTESPLFIKIVDHLPWISENIKRDCQCF